MTDRKGLRILAAEDDELNLFVLTKILRDAGHNVVEFPDGDLAWEYLENNPELVDLVILDKMMIQMHGMEVIRSMKGHPILKSIPTIMQSGDAYPDQIDEAVNNGVDRYITKPYEYFQLLEMINEVADKFSLGNNQAN